MVLCNISIFVAKKKKIGIILKSGYFRTPVYNTVLLYVLYLSHDGRHKHDKMKPKWISIWHRDGTYACTQHGPVRIKLRSHSLKAPL